MVDFPRHFLGLCAIAKDEDSILREWVIWHLLIGFEKILLYDNDSKTPVCDILEDFLNAGLVETHTIKGPQRQLTAYNHCLCEYGHDFRHLAFFDLDEFLFLRAESDARLMVADFAAHGALCLNMTHFSSDGHLSRPNDLVSASFCEILEVSPCTKWIVRPDLVDLPLSPHHFSFKGPATAVNTRNEPAVGGFVPPAEERARLNHYCWRSQQDYEERLRRGDAVYAKNPRSLDGFYAQARPHGTRDTGMLGQAGRIRAKMADPTNPADTPLRCEEVATLPVSRLLRLMHSLIKAGRAETALVMFSLRQQELWDNPEALTAALQAAAGAQNPFKTSALARRLLELFPTLSAYRRVAEALAGAGLHDEAKRLATYVAWSDKYLPADFAGR